MPIYDIFSKRQKRLRGEFPDVYQYETIPNELRVQVIHIWRDAFGAPYRGNQYPGGLLKRRINSSTQPCTVNMDSLHSAKMLILMMISSHSATFS